jgi:hypothetical protein
MVCSVQTVLLSCTDTNTISKRTKMRFHTIHLTYKFHWVCPKLFMGLWYVQWKPCTYLASRLTLSPNGPNRAPPEPRHRGVSSGASKTIYEPMVHLMETEHLSFTDASKRDSTWLRHLGAPLGASNTISKPMVRSTQTVHQSCIRSSTIPKRTEPSFHLSLGT